MNKNEIDYNKYTEYLSKRDPKLGLLIKQHGIVKLPPKEDSFTKFIKIIISQQLSNKAASTIFSRLENNITKFVPSHVYKVDDYLFRNAGVSKQKTSYIKNIAKLFLENKNLTEKLENLNDIDLEKYLISVKGLGQWSSSMYMMFNMHRINMFTYGDVALNKSIKSIYNIDVKNKDDFDELSKLENLWSPYKTLACLYLWKYVDSDESFL